MKAIPKLAASALAALLLSSTASAQTTFGPLAQAIRAQALHLPAETPVVALTPADTAHPRQSYTITRTFSADGSFTVVWKSATVDSTQSFRADGTIVRGRQKDTARGFDLEESTDPGRTTLRTIIWQNGDVKSDKKSALKAPLVLRSELQHLVLQAWDQGVRDGLRFQSFDPSGSMVGDFGIDFRTVSDPSKLSDKYTYPAEWLAAFKVGPYVVADMYLMGVGAFFYPHHFYLVYTQGPSGLQWAGYFGEDPKTPIFQYLKK